MTSDTNNPAPDWTAFFLRQGLDPPAQPARARRIGSPDALALALATLQPDPDELVAARAEQWQEQLTALEDARQALLEDRQNWLAGEPTVCVQVKIMSTLCHNTINEQYH